MNGRRLTPGERIVGGATGAIQLILFALGLKSLFNCFVEGTPVLVAVDDDALASSELNSAYVEQESRAQSRNFGLAGLALVVTVGGWRLLRPKTGRKQQQVEHDVDCVLESDDLDELARPEPRGIWDSNDDVCQDGGDQQVPLQIGS